MHAEDMSIFWNQSKGQYEANTYGAYDNDNTFTKTADQRLKYSVQTTYSETDYENDCSEETIKLESWLGTFILMLIPGVNVVSVIVLAISSKSPSKKTFARALLLLTLILITLALIFMVLTCDKIDYKFYIDKFIALGSKLLGTTRRLL